MHILFLFLFSFSLMAQDQGKVYQAQAEAMDAIYKDQSSLCGGHNYHVDLLADCNKTVKDNAQIEFNKYVQKILDSHLSVSASESCISQLRTKLELLNVAYKTDDNCTKLKEILEQAVKKSDIAVP